MAKRRHRAFTASSGEPHGYRSGDRGGGEAVRNTARDGQDYQPFACVGFGGGRNGQDHRIGGEHGGGTVLGNGQNGDVDAGAEQVHGARVGGADRDGDPARTGTGAGGGHQ